MYIKDFFKEDYNINWDFVENLNCFNKLSYTKQNSVWHKEKNALVHTKLVVCTMKWLLDKYGIEQSTDEWKILMMAALCHDLGKGETTKFDELKNEYTSKDHGIVGERITRSLLKDEDVLLREKICYLVRHHMALHHIFDDEDKFEHKFLKLSRGIDTLRHLIFLWTADAAGSINKIETIDTIKEKREFLINKAIELDIYHNTPTINEKDIAKYCNYCGEFVDEEKPFWVYIMCGFPGSGKTTYIKQYLSKLPVVSRDIIRCELNINGATQENQKKTVGTKEEEEKVTQIINKQMDSLCKDRKSFVIDNIHLKSKYRQGTIKRLIKYRPIIKIVYVEAPSFNVCKERRNGEISSEVYGDMRKKFDFPQLTECNILEIVKQVNDGDVLDITYLLGNGKEYKTVNKNPSVFETMVSITDVIERLKEIKTSMLNDGYTEEDSCICFMNDLINEYISK